MAGNKTDGALAEAGRRQSPEDFLPDGQRRCKAVSKQSRERCKRAVSPGALVCATHGGKAPQVKAAARLRLAELVDPAVATLAREMTSQTNKPGDRIRAAENILDRAGYGRQVDNGNVALARAILFNKFLAIKAEREPKAEETEDVVDAEVVEEGWDLL